MQIKSYQQNKSQTLREKFAIMGPPPMNSYRQTVTKDDTQFLDHRDRNTSLITSERLLKEKFGIATKPEENSMVSLKDKSIQIY